MNKYEINYSSSTELDSLASYLLKFCNENNLKIKVIFSGQQKKVEEYLKDIDICMMWGTFATHLWFKDFYHGTTFMIGKPS